MTGVTSPVSITMKKFLFWGVNFSILLLTYLALVRPVVLLFDAQARQLDELTVDLHRYERVALQMERAQALHSRAFGADATASFLEGDDVGAAGAALQNQLKHIIENAGLDILSISGRTPSPDSDQRRIGIEIDVSGTNAALAKVLLDIEQQTSPLLFVAAMTIRVPAGAENASAHVQPELNAQLVIFGAMAPEERDATP